MSLDGFWIGKPGSLVNLPGFVGEIGVDHDGDPSIGRSAAGKKWAFVAGDRPSRVWRVSIPTLTPDEVGVLQALQYEPLPEYLWLSVEAATTNALTPEASLGGPVIERVGMWRRDDGGLCPITMANPGAATADAPAIAGAAPVIGGSTVTGSCWMAGRLGPYVLLQWLDADGQPISSSWSQPVSKSLSSLHRAVITATAPANAIAVNVAPYRAEYFGQAALSWTEQPVEWGLGGLCLKGIVKGLRESIRRSSAAPDPYGRLRDISFTVEELG